ncbi:oligopeptide ABC transporter permease protein [Mycoplasmopsis californica HAZ160_1]|uniref:Oligopeptide ABC transporter permease protein n=1 Tax=Mycoplasmopsis californica HAZ160_1 TaxID=1397850 RepID=A0AAT9F7Z6_9BACT|nr:ABC transporter permease subunit [Mycoplasmopsis californica]BAP01013.1 oligopeptide ABC transporter permease protein [Mycoplasmopsis californica HAZ160_1]BBG40878.1 oligopeptide ABC transporter permease protein [Mycoplasmopsis californica]BBG41472.1 oligopeptide ABC transporter permease protein [Mycoplasmopsis californica]BBG42065.1 oligopeptide ABC transporter permease protein [Mycoplasmopsis californica]BBG42648.1 oligopeptide ABC transporter permease protein [Mycoplasmopsis californica]
MKKINQFSLAQKKPSYLSPTKPISSAKRFWLRFFSSKLNICGVIIAILLILFLIFSSLFNNQDAFVPINKATALNSNLPSTISPFKKIILPEGADLDVYRELRILNPNNISINEIINNNDGLRTYEVIANNYAIFNDNNTHLLGTNADGIDIFARILYAFKNAIVISIISALIALILGVYLGCIFAVYFNRKLSVIVEKILSTYTFIPYLIIASVLFLVIKNTLINSIVLYSFISTFIIILSSYQRAYEIMQRESTKAEISCGYTKFYLLHKSLFKPVFFHACIQAIEQINLILVSIAAISIFDIDLETLNIGTLIKEAVNIFGSNSAYLWFITALISLYVFSLKIIVLGLNSAYNNIRGDYV